MHYLSKFILTQVIQYSTELEALDICRPNINLRLIHVYVTVNGILMCKLFDASSNVIHVHVFMTLSHKYDMII